MCLKELILLKRLKHV